MAEKFKAPTHETITTNWSQLFDAINHENDLTCVVVATSYIDYVLSALLKAHFIESVEVDKLLNPATGAIGNLSSKLNIAYCLGLITKRQKQDIDIIGSIRNKFAHRIESVSFADTEIQEICDGLSVHPFMHDSGLVSSEKVVKQDDPDARRQARNKFRLAAVHLCIIFQLNAIGAVKCKRPEEANHSTDTVVDR